MVPMICISRTTSILAKLILVEVRPKLRPFQEYAKYRLFEVREAFKRTFCYLVFGHIFAHISHFFRLRRLSGGPPGAIWDPPPGVLRGFLQGACARTARNTRRRRVALRRRRTTDECRAAVRRARKAYRPKKSGITKQIIVNPPCFDRLGGRKTT